MRKYGAFLAPDVDPRQELNRVEDQLLSYRTKVDEYSTTRNDLTESIKALGAEVETLSVSKSLPGPQCRVESLTTTVLRQIEIRFGLR